MAIVMCVPTSRTIATAGITLALIAGTETSTYAQNQAPLLDPISHMTVVVETLVAFGVACSDPDGDPVTVSAWGVPTGAAFNAGPGGSASFSWTPAAGQIAIYGVTFVCTDGTGSTTQPVMITVVAPNMPPAFGLLANQTLFADTPLAVSIRATDPEGDPIVLAAVNIPYGATFVDLGRGIGLLEWTPSRRQPGTHEAVFSASDGMGATEASIRLIVRSPAIAPMLGPVSDQTVTEGDVVMFRVSAYDTDGDAVTIAATGAPSTATFNGVSGAFHWTTQVGDAGTYHVTFVATDALGLSGPGSTVKIIVLEKAKPDAGAATSIDAGSTSTFDAGQTTSIDAGGARTDTGTGVPDRLGEIEAECSCSASRPEGRHAIGVVCMLLLASLSRPDRRRGRRRTGWA